MPLDMITRLNWEVVGRALDLTRLRLATVRLKHFRMQVLEQVRVMYLALFHRQAQLALQRALQVEELRRPGFPAAETGGAGLQQGFGGSVG